MSNRMVRVNELVMREISEIIHTAYQAESVAITIVEVDVAPDLRRGDVYYSVFGDSLAIRNAERFFRKFQGRIRYMLGQRITLKYMPEFHYHYDPSMERGANLINLMDELEEESPEKNRDA